MQTDYTRTFVYNGKKFFAKSARVIDDISAPIGCFAVTFQQTTCTTWVKHFGRNRIAAQQFADDLNAK